jgi:cell division protein ZapA
MTDRVVHVDVLGQRYAIRSTLEPDYIARLAACVDQKMRAAADVTPNGDSVRFAVLAALNIADELFRCREANQDRDGLLAERAGEIERLLDRVLLA